MKEKKELFIEGFSSWILTYGWAILIVLAAIGATIYFMNVDDCYDEVQTKVVINYTCMGEACEGWLTDDCDSFYNDEEANKYAIAYNMQCYNFENVTETFCGEILVQE